jgi:hypothetical protein
LKKSGSDEIRKSEIRKSEIRKSGSDEIRTTPTFPEIREIT